MTSINDRPFPKHVKFGYLNLIVYKRQEFKLVTGLISYKGIIFLRIHFRNLKFRAMGHEIKKYSNYFSYTYSVHV